jgi:hypothetical protein
VLSGNEYALHTRFVVNKNEQSWICAFMEITLTYPPYNRFKPTIKHS